MSFNSSNLSLAWSGNGRGPWPFTIFDYSTSDNLSAIETSPGGASYFYPDPLSFRVGDLVRVTAGDGNAIYAIASLHGSGGRIEVIKLADASTFPSSEEEYGGGDGT